MKNLFLFCLFHYSKYLSQLTVEHHHSFYLNLIFGLELPLSGAISSLFIFVYDIFLCLYFDCTISSSKSQPPSVALSAGRGSLSLYFLSETPRLWKTGRSLCYWKSSWSSSCLSPSCWSSATWLLRLKRNSVKYCFVFMLKFLNLSFSLSKDRFLPRSALSELSQL